MVQISSYLKVLEVFFKEPTRIHFIKGISRNIKIAHTSVRNNIKRLEKIGLISKKKSNPFDGYVANRESDAFIHYKQAYNLFSLFELKKFLIEEIHPKTLIVFGSYSRGEDIEESDLDIILVSKVKRELSLSRFEKKLSRKININFISFMSELEKPVRNNALNGWVLYGGLNG
tara:strand:+ start:35 stop:553 length:519 start_codon:yes stop_codon:yes gene_type:complete